MERNKRITLDNSGLRSRGRSLSDVTVQFRPSKKYATLTTRTAPIKLPEVPKPIVRKEIDQRHVAKEPLLAPKRYIFDVTPAPHIKPQKVIQVQEKALSPSISDIVANIQVHSGSDEQLPKNFKKHSKFSFLFGFFAVLLMVGGVVALISSFSSNKAVTQQVQALTEAVEKVEEGESTSGDISTLSEDIIPDTVINSYSVGQNVPRYIRIEKLGGRNVRVLRMAVDDKGSIKTPKSIWDAGWYEGSSVPGEQNGASLILGHVSGPNEGGVFYNLYRLTEGDTIEVEMGNGAVYTYTVVSKEEVPTGEINMNRYLVSQDIDKQGLTLMTCAGEFNPSTQQYENRLAVFAIRTQ